MLDCPWESVGALAAMGYGATGAVLMALLKERRLRSAPEIKRLPPRTRAEYHALSVLIGVGVVGVIYWDIPCLTPWMSAVLGWLGPSILDFAVGAYRSTRVDNTSDLTA